MYVKSLLLTILLAMTAVLPVHADEQALSKTLKSAFGRAPDQVGDSPLAGMKEVLYGTEVYYVTSDGRYLISGTLFDLNKQENLTEKRLTGIRKEMLKDVSEKDMIIFKAKGKEKHVITVFTDIDCVYCRKLHSGMDEMNKLGITVRYLAYPRAGIGSPSYDKAVSVWCADDRNKAISDAKNNNIIVPKKCDAPVAAQYQLGQKIGVNSTPSIVLEDGHLMPGYAPPAQMLQLIENKGRVKR